MSRYYSAHQHHQSVHEAPFPNNHHSPVIPNTSSGPLIQPHEPGNAAANGASSSFQTPVVAGQALSSSPSTHPVGHPSPVPSSSSIQHIPVVVRSPLLDQSQMGHGQSKATPPLPLSSPPPQSLTPGGNHVLDPGLSSTKGANGKKLKRPFGTKMKESTDSYSLAYKDTTGETITVSNSSSPLSPPTISSEYAPDSLLSVGFPQHSSPPSQALPKNIVVSSSSPAPISQPSISSGREHPSKGPSITAGSSAILPKPSPSTLDPPAAAGNRSSVIALSPGISSAINFMMMEWQEPSKPQLTVEVSSTQVSTSSSPPTGDVVPFKADTQKEKESVRRRSSGLVPTSPDKREMKESWRKSDSTNSHHTVRANSLRASRPVSWAESFHSAYTIVPANGGSIAPQGPSTRRLSGLIADVDFGVREEELEEDIDPNANDGLSLHFATSNHIQDSGPPTRDLNLPVPHKKSRDLLKKANRRSLSLSSALPGLLTGIKPLPPHTPVQTTMATPAYPSAPEARKVSYSISGVDPFRTVSHSHSRQQSENLLHQRSPVSAEVTHHVPSIAFSTSQSTCSTQDNISLQQPSTTSNLKGRLQALLPPLPRSEQGLPAIPPDSLDPPADLSAHTHLINFSHLRQPTISSLGPSAAGMAKRAVERMSRRLGDMMNGLSSSSNSSISAHSSSTSISTSASTSLTSGTSLVPSPLSDSHMQQSPAGYVPGGSVSRGSNPVSAVAPQGSGHSHHHSMMHVFLPGPSKSGGHKRLQKSLGSPAILGDVPISGGSSSALSSASTSESDPFSPTGPILGRCLRGPLKKGSVFGRELRTAVNETRVVVKANDDGVEGSPSRKGGLIKVLEHRILPAVVVRCAQHLLIWGVQEEGLFRVNGRPRHVSHLRAEFDAGADYDMTECSPSEVDPHAVASVFKAYLRELPDSILTQKLQPYFDAAINRENSLHTQEQRRPQQPSTKIHQGPASLHRPPSLSTLAMPSFKQVPAPSRSLIYALRSLIAQLPPENRDLIRTVVDLIKATAKGSKATKMPLSNLLLLFCPSLNMSPPLLRILCEAEGIWEEERIIDISRERVEQVLDDEPSMLVSSRNTGSLHDDDEVDTKFDEESSLRSGRASSDNPSSLDYHASAEEDSLFSEDRAALRRRDIADRPEIPTVYLDTRSHLSSSSASLLPGEADHQHPGSISAHREMRDDGSISSGPYSFKNYNIPICPSPPPLSSSAESVSTPTSSANASFSNLPLDGSKDFEQPKRSDADLPSAGARALLQIVGSEPGEIRKRPFISNPIPISGPLPAQYPFPTSRIRANAPSTPSRRRSIPLLSLSSLSSRSSGSPSASPSSKDFLSQADSRTKKPSLKLLFSKKSTSSLFEGKERPVISLPMLQPPEPRFQNERGSLRSGSGSDSSISTPLSAVTAPQGSSVLCLPGTATEGPPVLNTLIEDSSLKFDGFIPDKDPAKFIPDMPSSRLSAPPLVTKGRSVSGDSVSHPKSPLSIITKLDTQPSLSGRLPPSRPTDEEWMRSVLRAADEAMPSQSKFL